MRSYISKKKFDAIIYNLRLEFNWFLAFDINLLLSEKFPASNCYSISSNDKQSLLSTQQRNEIDVEQQADSHKVYYIYSSLSLLVTKWINLFLFSGFPYKFSSKQFIFKVLLSIITYTSPNNISIILYTHDLHTQKLEKKKEMK